MQLILRANERNLLCATLHFHSLAEKQNQSLVVAHSDGSRCRKDVCGFAEVVFLRFLFPSCYKQANSGGFKTICFSFAVFC